jgi:hypothetical protein
MTTRVSSHSIIKYNQVKVVAARKKKEMAMSVNIQNDSGVATELYLSQKRERKISIKPWMNMVCEP